MPSCAHVIGVCNDGGASDGEPAGLRAIWLIWRRMSSSATAAVTPRIRARAASLTAGGPRETWTRLWPWAPVLVAAIYGLAGNAA